jgi:hypothetical protein
LMAFHCSLSAMATPDTWTYNQCCKEASLFLGSYAITLMSQFS